MHSVRAFRGTYAAHSVRQTHTASASAPALLLGTMTFGWKQASSFTDDKIAADMIRSFMRHGSVELDCARIYAGGVSEEMLGRVVKALPSSEREKLVMGTKAHPMEPGGLSLMVCAIK